MKKYDKLGHFLNITAESVFALTRRKMITYLHQWLFGTMDISLIFTVWQFLCYEKIKVRKEGCSMLKTVSIGQ